MDTRKLLSALLSLILLACEPATELTLEQLLDRHAEARGGIDKLTNLNSVRIGLRITEPEFTVRGDYVAARDGHMRIDIYAGDERVFTEALSPHDGWQLHRGETTGIDLSPDGDKALERGLIGNLYALQELPDLGYRLSFAGTDSIVGEKFWVIDLTAPDRFTKRLFFDPESYLLVREQECSALHPDIDPTEYCFESRMERFASFDGIVYAQESRKYAVESGELVQTTEIESVQINPQFDNALFERPGG